MDDADAALDDDEELVAGLALADERLALIEPALRRHRRDPLEVFGRQLLEQRDAPELEHRRDVAGGAAGVGQVVSARLQAAGHGPDPLVVIIAQSSEHRGRVLDRVGRRLLDQSGDGPSEPAIADRIERLDGLGAHVRVRRAEASTDDATGRGSPERRHRRESHGLGVPDPVVEDRAQEVGVGVIGRTAGAQDGACARQLDRPIDLAVGPRVDPVADGLAAAGQGGDGGGFGGHPVGAAEEVDDTRVDLGARGERRGGRGPNADRWVAEAREQRIGSRRGRPCRRSRPSPRPGPPVPGP